MSLFLFKPHVEGLEGQITTPDVVIERLFVDGVVRSVSFLTSETRLQLEPNETLTPAYALTALGGGALIGPAVVLGSGLICAARRAWRLGNLDDHVGTVTLNGAPLSRIGLPAESITAAGGSGDRLPRGVMSIRTSDGDGASAELGDAHRRRTLSLRVVGESVDYDRWAGARPTPRYSIGPTRKDIEHYI